MRRYVNLQQVKDEEPTWADLIVQRDNAPYAFRVHVCFVRVLSGTPGGVNLILDGDKDHPVTITPAQAGEPVTVEARSVRVQASDSTISYAARIWFEID